MPTHTPPALPLVQFARVYHRGSLQGRGGLVRPSHEGRCLSVAMSREASDAWLMIAQLGGLPCWRLRRADGVTGRFVDMHALLDAATDTTCGALRAALVEDAIARAWLTPSTTRVWRFHDDELDGDYTRVLSHEETAMAVLLDEGWWPDGVPTTANDDDPALTAAAAMEIATRLTTVSSFAATPALQARWAATFSGACVVGQSPLDPHEFALLELLAEHAEGWALDGVYWNDRLDPAIHSAPRAGIFDARVAAWTAAAT